MEKEKTKTKPTESPVKEKKEKKDKIEKKDNIEKKDKKPTKNKGDDPNPPYQGSPEGKQTEPVQKHLELNIGEVKDKFVKATAQYMKDEGIISGPGIKDYLLFLLRLVAVGIIIAAFLNTYMNNFNDVNVVIEDVAHLHVALLDCRSILLDGCPSLSASYRTCTCLPVSGRWSSIPWERCSGSISLR